MWIFVTIKRVMPKRNAAYFWPIPELLHLFWAKSNCQNNNTINQMLRSSGSSDIWCWFIWINLRQSYRMGYMDMTTTRLLSSWDMWQHATAQNSPDLFGLSSTFAAKSHTRNIKQCGTKTTATKNIGSGIHLFVLIKQYISNKIYELKWYQYLILINKDFSPVSFEPKVC